jgi:hypothetical protein
MLRKFLMSHGPGWPAAGLVLSLAAGAAGAAEGTAARNGILRLRCTNHASGTNWVIVVDLDRHLVDSQPATITDKWVSWPDPKQGSFDLERATGKLEFRNPSSTGGYFLFYTCEPE